jgi:hypothetical protein
MVSEVELGCYQLPAAAGARRYSVSTTTHARNQVSSRNLVSPGVARPRKPGPGFGHGQQCHLPPPRPSGRKDGRPSGNGPRSRHGLTAHRIPPPGNRCSRSGWTDSCSCGTLYGSYRSCCSRNRPEERGRFKKTTAAKRRKKRKNKIKNYWLVLCASCAFLRPHPSWPLAARLPSAPCLTQSLCGPR